MIKTKWIDDIASSKTFSFLIKILLFDFGCPNFDPLFGIEIATVTYIFLAQVSEKKLSKVVIGIVVSSERDI